MVWYGHFLEEKNQIHGNSLPFIDFRQIKSLETQEILPNAPHYLVNPSQHHHRHSHSQNGSNQSDLYRVPPPLRPNPIK